MLCVSTLAAQVKVTKPLSKQSNSFAIVTDQTTFDKVGRQLLAYRDVLEADGLSTYIVSGRWENPDQVRDQIGKLYARSRNLEGIVLVGDIPYVMVRNAQHMTTAFKMDEEKFPIDQSSVASDRFYDDLHLSFEFLERDSLEPLRFYYKLSENSPQQLAPNFYSGRIFYPPQLGGDKYEAIARFLEKAVEAKRNPDPLDHIVTFAGHGYNSDCLLVWQDEKIAMKENFPFTGKTNLSAKHLNFRMEQYMKYKLFDELQRPEVDVFLFNEHGSIDKQHISGGSSIETVQDRLAMLRASIEMQLLFTPKGKREEARRQIMQEMGLGEKFFEAGTGEEETDGEATDENIISLDDLKGFNPQPRFVMFNACYNGSFHRPGNIAGYYIFGEGRTIATQGNTVNVLQDKWTYEMVGLISHGVRIGEYNRQIATLEGHIVGDPTFHFADSEGCTLRRDIVAKGGDAAYWRTLLDAPYADIRSIALRKLTDLGAISSAEIVARMKESPFATTRMECLKLLSRFRDDAYVEGIRLGLYDSYELTRRNAADYAWRAGDPRLVPAIMDVLVRYPESQRVNYLLQKAVNLYPADGLIAELERMKPTLTDADPEQAAARIREMIEEQRSAKEKTMQALLDKQAPLARRIQSARYVRNYTYHEYVPQLLALVGDSAEELSLRVNVAEALGWFNKSVSYDEIARGCRQLLENPALEPQLRKELVQTLNRLK